MAKATLASCPRSLLDTNYGFASSLRFTSRSFVSPRTLTVALAVFSSIETIVASTDLPSTVTFTLSPAFHAIVAGAVASADGLGAGVAVTVAGVAAGFASGGADSHAPRNKAKANTQVSFVAMFAPKV